MKSFFFFTSTFAFISAATLSAGEFSLKEAPGKHLEILQDGKTIGRYMLEHDITNKEAHDLTYKPYLHVFDAEGTAPITKGAGGEFTHHRGLFIGWMKITVNGKTVDRWHMKNGKGDEVKVGEINVADIVHQKFTEQKADAQSATITSLNHWLGTKEGEVILEEERTMSFLPAPNPAYALIDFTSKVKAVAGDTALNGDPEHAGLQFRPSDSVDRSLTKYLYPVPNAVPHKDRDYPWVAETFTLKEGKTYSIIYLNHPTNPKGAPISAYRDYGRFGLFFNGAIKKGETFTTHIRIIVKEGDMPEADWIQKQANAFTGIDAPTPTTTSLPAEHAAPKPKSPEKKEDKAKK
jgi:hypothetical protein